MLKITNLNEEKKIVFLSTSPQFTQNPGKLDLNTITIELSRHLVQETVKVVF